MGAHFKRDVAEPRSLSRRRVKLLLCGRARVNGREARRMRCFALFSRHDDPADSNVSTHNKCWTGAPARTKVSLHPWTRLSGDSAPAAPKTVPMRHKAFSATPLFLGERLSFGPFFSEERSNEHKQEVAFRDDAGRARGRCPHPAPGL